MVTWARETCQRGSYLHINKHIIEWIINYRQFFYDEYPLSKTIIYAFLPKQVDFRFTVNMVICFNFLNIEFGVYMIEKHIPVRSIVLAVSIKFCDQSDLAILKSQIM